MDEWMNKIHITFTPLISSHISLNFLFLFFVFYYFVHVFDLLWCGESFLSASTVTCSKVERKRAHELIIPISVFIRLLVICVLYAVCVQCTVSNERGFYLDRTHKYTHKFTPPLCTHLFIARKTSNTKWCRTIETTFMDITLGDARKGEREI